MTDVSGGLPSKTRGCLAGIALLAMPALLAGCADSTLLSEAGKPTSNSETKSTKQSPEPSLTNPKGFDECSLVTSDEFAAAVEEPELYVTGRGIFSRGQGHWQVVCNYGTTPTVDNGHFRISTSTGVTEEEFFLRTFSTDGSASDPVSGLGDRAVLYELQDDGLVRKQLNVVQGSVGMVIGYTRYDSDASGEELALPSGSLEEIARTALDRLPSSVTITPDQAKGLCTELDRAVAADALGGDIVGARTVEGPSESLVCSYAPRQRAASLRVTVRTDPKIVANGKKIISPDLEGFGQVASFGGFSTDQFTNVHAKIATRNKIISVLLNHQQDSDRGEREISEPTPEQERLLREIVGTFG